MEKEEKSVSFKFEKSIPLALLVTVIIQVIGIVWGAASISNNVQKNTENLSAVQQQLRDARTASVSERNALYHQINELKEKTIALEYEIKSLTKK